MQQGRGISRRALFGAGAGVAAGAALGLRAGGATGEAAAAGAVAKQSLLPPERIGLQLYSVRDAVAEQGFAKVLETLAEIGFKRVEFAGYTQGTGPITTKELRALLDANGLIAAGSHVSPGNDESMKAILDDAAVLGIPDVGISLVVPEGPLTTSSWQTVAEDFNRYGELARQRGVGFYWHNHFEEWFPVVDAPGKRGMDILLESTDPKLVHWECDIFWAYVGRAQSGENFDPLLDYVIPQRDRIKLFHVKDGRPREAQFTDVGEGEIDFQALFTTLFSQAPGLRERFVYLWERDNAGDHPRGPLAAARSSFVNMRYGLFQPAGGAVDCGPAAGFTAAVTSTSVRGRRVRVKLELGAPAQVAARVTRGRKTLGSANRQLAAGSRTIDVRLPRRATAGAATLNLTISNGAGVTLQLRDPLRLPKGRA